MAITGPKYVLQERKAYSMYILQQRAIPAITDGMKAGGRRTLWVARDGHKYKTASLAGATMPLHPHGDTAGSINTLAAPYGNNIPLFKGDGAFGTLIAPKAYGASRYTAVTASKFTQDVIYRDIEIIPMQENYDGSIMEPIHFLPLVPIALVNPSSGIAVGFASTILPRKLEDIINYQIAFLNQSPRKPKLIPYFAPTDDLSYYNEGNSYHFQGDFTIQTSSSMTITRLPYGVSHQDVEEKILKAMEQEIVLSCVDETKRDVNIKLKFKRGYLDTKDRAQILKMFKLDVSYNENLTVVDFTGQFVLKTTPENLIEEFTSWRLTWFVQRYQRLHNLLVEELQRYYDVQIAIKNNVGALARKAPSRAQLKEQLAALKIVNLDYVADLPVYRFTDEERIKNEQKIAEKEKTLSEYNNLLANEDSRRQVYITELQEILSKHKKGTYTE